MSSPVWIIAKREFNSFFDSLTAYILLIAFLGFSGFFTWLFGSDIFFRGQADLQVFFSVAYWTLFIFIPALTMRMLSEEKRSGTIELLLTKAVTDRQLVSGKFLSALMLIGVALLCTIPYYITLTTIGKVDHGAIWCGYLGLLLMSASYISIGLYTSSVTSNQIVAFLLALFVGIFFHFLFSLISSGMTGFMGKFFNYLSLETHYDSITRGLIDTKDLIYFLSIVIVGIILAELNVSKRS